jgi:hypothetical protein
MLWRLTAALTFIAILLSASPGSAGLLDASWAAPTTNIDGSSLTSLVSYRVYFGTGSAPCPGPSFLPVASPASSPSPNQTVGARLTGLATGTRYFVAVTAVDSGGNESACSTVASAVARADYAAVVSAVLPGSRSVQVGVPAAGFASVINTGSITATACRISPITGLSAAFVYQTTDATTNQVIGTPNTPADIAPGASQSFVFAFTPTAAIAPTQVVLNFDCLNASPAPNKPEVNTLLLSASTTPVPDAVALAATSTNDGILNLANTGIFAVTTANLGTGGTMTVSADTGSATLPVSVALCETDPTTGQCANPTVPATSPIVTTVDANEVATFGIFVTPMGTVPFDPASNRIFVRFKDADGVIRGSTSVAVRTQ